MLSGIVKRYMRDPVKTYFGLVETQVKFLINLKLEILMRPVCQLMIILLLKLLYLIIKLKIYELILLKNHPEIRLSLPCM